MIFFPLVIPRLKSSALFDFVSITEEARSYTDIREEISKQFEFVNVRKRRLSCRVCYVSFVKFVLLLK